jgi:predicted phosphodiesterase
MRIAIFSDIHGNAFALETMLGDLKRDSVDQIVCLGDAIQGGAQPLQTVALLRDLGCPVVMGNADDWLLTGDESDEEGISSERLVKMNAVRDWMLSELSAADQSFIRSFQPTAEIPLDDGRNLLCFHGSPTSFHHVMLPTTPEEEFQGYLTTYLPNIMCGGHTHMQQIRRIGTSDSFFFNPGSVGFAYSHQQDEANFKADPWAEYAILNADNRRLSLEFRRVPYDAKTVADIYLSSGRPHAQEAAAQYPY